MYNAIVMDHFVNPRNVGLLVSADAKGETGNPADGDKICIYIQVKDNRLERVQFQTFGCAAAIASSSMLTVLALHKTLEEAMEITNDDVANALGGLPEGKLLCSNIAATALHHAIEEYIRKSGATTERTTCSFENESKQDEAQAYLSKEQIERYLRQIIMPEISGLGQQKLLKTKVQVYSQSILDAELILLYLAAMGIGSIDCVISAYDDAHFDCISHAKDLNPDCTITRYTLDTAELVKSSNTVDLTVNHMIVLGSEVFIDAIQKYFLCNYHCESALGVPITVVKTGDFCGSIYRSTLFMLNAIDLNITKTLSDGLGQYLSNAWGGVLATIEVVKTALGLGRLLEKPLYYNLGTFSFGFSSDVLNELSEIDWRFKHDVKAKLALARVLVIGSGGLGSPAMWMLARLGVGTLGIVDDDRVSVSNLNRQIVHGVSRLGIEKVVSAKQTLEMLNPNIKVEAHAMRFNDENARELLKTYDCIVDGVDNLKSRYSVNKEALLQKKTFIQSGVLSYYGQAITLDSEIGPCYTCIFPQSLSEAHTPSCEETGILGAVPGLMGIMEALETVRVLLNIQPALHGNLLMVDVLDCEFDKIPMLRDPKCVLHP